MPPAAVTDRVKTAGYSTGHKLLPYVDIYMHIFVTTSMNLDRGTQPKSSVVDRGWFPHEVVGTVVDQATPGRRERGMLGTLATEDAAPRRAASTAVPTKPAWPRSVGSSRWWRPAR